MKDLQRLKNDYPWAQTPLVIGAPMRLIALADMAVEISKAGKTISVCLGPSSNEHVHDHSNTTILPHSSIEVTEKC